MAAEVFVDTSGFYVCLVSRDDQHERAAELLRSAEGSRRFMTTDYVLNETVCFAQDAKPSTPDRSILEHHVVVPVLWHRVDGCGQVRDGQDLSTATQ